MVFQTFTRRRHAAVKDPRRRRMSEVAPAIFSFLTMTGAILEKVTTPKFLETMPATWRPFVFGFAIACAAVAMVEQWERRRDFRRYLARQDQQR